MSIFMDQFIIHMRWVYLLNRSQEGQSTYFRVSDMEGAKFSRINGRIACLRARLFLCVYISKINYIRGNAQVVGGQSEMQEYHQAH